MLLKEIETKIQIHPSLLPLITTTADPHLPLKCLNMVVILAVECKEVTHTDKAVVTEAAKEVLAKEAMDKIWDITWGSSTWVAHQGWVSNHPNMVNLLNISTAKTKVATCSK